MNRPETLPPESFLQEDPFGFIKPQEFGALGIDPGDVPPGTFAARKHPARLLSRSGGNAYGFGFFEGYDRLGPKDLKLLQALSFKNLDQTRQAYKEINRIYKDLGLLIRFSSLGKPFYLIPLHLVSSSLSTVRNKADEISKIIGFHRKKYLKESHRIGLLTHADDQIVNELAVRFKEHQFVVLDSYERLRSLEEPLDLVVLSRDIYEIIFMENFSPRTDGVITRKELDRHASYMVGKIYRLLKPGGEVFIVAHRFPVEKNRHLEVTFRTDQEMKSFLLFSHIFKTKKRYPPAEGSLQVDSFDLQKYLNPPYVEEEVADRLLGGHRVGERSLQEIHALPYLDFPLQDRFSHDQEKAWSRLLSVYFDQIFLKSLVPECVKAEWKGRFATAGYLPDYMLIYLGQKRHPQTTLEELKREVAESRLAGCPLPLVADYRDSFDYVITSLEVLKRMKGGGYPDLPQLYMDRLREPMQNKKRRYGGLNDVIKLMSKTARLHKIRSLLNPGKIEGGKTRILDHIETLSLLGFTHGELREIFLSVVGHTPMGRILCGKMSEKALKPVSDFARTMEPQQALNLLRYCRLMSMAETAASKGAALNPEEVAELFDLYERIVRVVTNREMDWDKLLDERMGALGGIRNEAVRKILKMMNHFQFLSNWTELSLKGDMEKETLADYDAGRLQEIERVIQLVHTIGRFEDTYFKDDPLSASVFYRKFLNMEFHGTVHVFGRLPSEVVFPLLWITVNVARGDVINFNPIFSHVGPSGIDGYAQRLEGGAGTINVRYLDLQTLEQFGEHLYEDECSFILGTGFQLRVNPVTHGIDVDYIDMDENLRNLETLSGRIKGGRISGIPEAELRQLETLFSNLESFYQSHVKFVSHEDQDLRMPGRERDWFKRGQDLREVLRSGLIGLLFRAEEIHTGLDLLYRHCPSLLEFLIPEFMALDGVEMTDQAPLGGSPIQNILACTKKLQALVERNRTAFQDVKLLHKAAQREFGPMAAGIVGLNETQIEILEEVVQRLRETPALFDALVKAFILSGTGLHPSLREKYRAWIHPCDHGQAGALILERERIAEKYVMDDSAYGYLVAIIRYQGLLHEMIRGEFSFYAIDDVVQVKDRNLFDAIFLSSFILFYAAGEDMILEDLATRLFQFRSLCHRIMAGETNPERHLEQVFAAKGRWFRALEAYSQEGSPEDVSPASYLASFAWQESERENYVKAGRMIYALERIFRLRGIRYVEFVDLAHSLAKVPLKYIYRKRRHFGIGYATFEKELFEAQRIYNSLQGLPERARHFLLRGLVADEVRIFGFERVSAFLNYDNQIKLLWIALLGAEKVKGDRRPGYVDFLRMGASIEKRYEAVNDVLSRLSPEEIWGDRHEMKAFFGAKTGVVFRKLDAQRVLSVEFVDPLDLSGKISAMMDIDDEGQLKDYFHRVLRSLRECPFYTEDYEMDLERAFDRRLKEITDLILDQVKRRIDFLREFRQIHDLVRDLMERALEIGFTEEQKHRLNDLYELRKDRLKREKLEEIEGFLEKMQDMEEVKDYWDSIKWYLSGNRFYLGKEFESLVARRFDEAAARIRAQNG
ncbi:MAG: hypothetical protein JXL84_24225 [Deltaproteobacteria bacterium]|nr:hypothetical protein [Deltaproteobacteria bacterium]